MKKYKNKIASEYKYQQNSQFFAQIAENLKEAGAKELSELGARDIVTTFRGIHFSADKSVLYRINYKTRLLSRILATLVSFNCHHADRLYQRAKQIKWEDFFSNAHTFAVSGNVSDSNISHSKFASLCLKDAVVDYFREKTGKRPNVDTITPDIRLNLHIRKNRADISIDTSGGRLTRMEAISSKSINEEALRMAKSTLSRLESVLNIIDDSDFGLCKECEEPIPIARLMVIPETYFCVECASKMDL